MILLNHHTTKLGRFKEEKHDKFLQLVMYHYNNQKNLNYLEVYTNIAGRDKPFFRPQLRQLEGEDVSLLVNSIQKSKQSEHTWKSTNEE